MSCIATNKQFNIIQVDVVGECPTSYKLTKLGSGSGVIVTKSKDHRECTQRVGGLTQSEASGVPIKNPVQMIQSKSTCEQYISDGIVKSVVCKDTNEITHAQGMKKRVIAHQISTLQLKDIVTSNHIPSIRAMKESSIVFTPSIPMKESKNNALLTLKLNTLCQSVQLTNLGQQFSSQYMELVEVMDIVEEEHIAKTLRQIEEGQICSQSKETVLSLYLDALASTKNPGAIGPMVEKILHGERVYQYSWRIQSFPVVCDHALAHVKRLFESDNLPVQARIAAGSAVARHCQIYSCEDKVAAGDYREVMRILSHKLDSSCQRSEQKSSESEAIALLKAAQSLKRSTSELESSLLTCTSKSTRSKSVKLQAADALRQLPSLNKQVQICNK